MQQRLWTELFILLKIVLMSPIAGAMLTICVFEIAEKVFSHEFPKTTYKKRRMICWLYLTMIVIIIALLIKAFAH